MTEPLPTTERAASTEPLPSTVPLRVLLVEDSPSDAKLVLLELQKIGRPIVHERVQDEPAMRAALENGAWHVIVCDWSMPHFGVRAALVLVRQMGLDTPFIIVTGTMGEETAVDAMRAGAKDYVLKSNLTRLPAIVERELREAEERAARRRAEDLVRLEQGRFRALVESSSDGIMLATAEGVILYASPAAARMFERPADELLGTAVFDHYEPDEARAAKALVTLLRAAPGKSVETTRRIARSSGGHRQLEVTLRNALADPTVGAIVCNLRDRTEQSQTQAALVVAQTRFDRLLESGIIGVVLSDIAGPIRDANDAYLQLIGRSREDVVAGRVQWMDLLVPENAAIDAAAGMQMAERGATAPWETVILRPDGTRVPVLTGVARLDETTTIGFAADLTDRKRTEAALVVAEERFTKLFESGIIGITIAEPTGRIFDANDAFLSMLGYSRAELEAGGLDWAKMTPPEWRDWAAETGDDLRVHRATPPREKEYLRKDGSRIPVLAGVASLAGARAISVTVDLTDRKRAESTLKETENRLRHAQKMEAVGRLAGGIAHDFNNLLSVILSYAELMFDDLRAGDPMRADVAEIRNAAKRAADLTRQLLMFSRQQVIEPKVVDLNELIANMAGMLRRLLGEGVVLSSTASEALGRVRVDPGSMEQVVMNLAVNARDAMPSGGTLTLEITDVVLLEGDPRCDAGMMPGPYVKLSARDTGVGMDEATRTRAFEPFFTTKEVGKGTGLGLSTLFGIVQQSGGSTRIESSLGKGTTFRIYLPSVNAAVEHATLAPPSTTSRGTETILLVEDDDALRTVARGILIRGGYRVLEARNAGEALLTCEAQAGGIDLLVTDVVMPQMSGPDLARRLATLRPDMRVLCMSGYTDEPVLQRGTLDGSFAFLQKPITPDSLTQKVRDVLDARPQTRVQPSVIVP